MAGNIIAGLVVSNGRIPPLHRFITWSLVGRLPRNQKQFQTQYSYPERNATITFIEQNQDLHAYINHKH